MRSYLGRALVALGILALDTNTSAGLPSQWAPGDAAFSAAAGNQREAALAAGANSTLVVWSDGRANTTTSSDIETGRDIYGIRLDASGAPLDAAPIPIATVKAAQQNPQAAWNGSSWLVLFESYTVSGTGGYYEKSLAFTRVSASGVVLDPTPVPIHNAVPITTQWTVTSDGTNWILGFMGMASSSDLIALRVSPDGVVLDPPTHSLAPGTYYMRFNLRMACASGVCLATFNDAFGSAGTNTGAVLFDGELNVLGGGLFTLFDTTVADLASSGSGFYAVLNQQQPDFSTAVIGHRIGTNGQKLDGAGVNISGANPPQPNTTTSLAWDGANWRAVWGYNGAVSVARVSPSGQVLDPGGVSVAGPSTGPAAGTSNGGLQLAWTAYANDNEDVWTAHIAANNTAGPSSILSTGAPMQLRPAIASGASGSMLVYLSATAAAQRVLAQPLDAAGAPLTSEPIELASAGTASAPGAPAIAWNGSEYLVAWGNSGGIVAQRLQQDGTKLDAAPFQVLALAFGTPAVAAVDGNFLVVGRKYSTPQVIYAIGARVSNAGSVLDPSGIVLGGGYLRSPPAAVAFDGRWLVAWHSNWTHDESNATTGALFVNPDGSRTAEAGMYLFSTAGGNGVFEIGLAAGGGSALLVQSAEITSGVETDLVGWLIDPNGAMGPTTNLTPWRGNQYRPRVAWDGTQFVVVYQDQRNNFAENGADAIDARGDLYGMRVSAAGTVIDPQGFLISNSPLGELYPAISSTGAGGSSRIAASLLRNEPQYLNYRIGHESFGGANPPPVAGASASASEGDVPLAVDFSSAGSADAPGSIATYAWDFGDGASSTQPSPSHTYTSPGQYVAKLTLTDDQGATTTQTVRVEARPVNQAPLALASASPASGPVPLDVTFSANGSYDPDGSIGNILWTYHDGSETWGQTGGYSYAEPGTYQVSVTVYDNRGATGIDTVSVSVGNTSGTPTRTRTPTPAATQTQTPEPSATQTPTPTETPQVGATQTPEPSATQTPTPSATQTPTSGTTQTPEPSATQTPTPTTTPEDAATPTPTPPLKIVGGQPRGAFAWLLALLGTLALGAGFRRSRRAADASPRR